MKRFVRSLLLLLLSIGRRQGRKVVQRRRKPTQADVIRRAEIIAAQRWYYGCQINKPHAPSTARKGAL